MRNTIFILVALVLFACNRNYLNIDVSNIECKVELARMDEMLFANDTATLFIAIENMPTYYRPFFETYGYDVIKVGGVETPGFKERLSQFVCDTVYRQVAATVLDQFKNVDDLKDGLEEGFKHFLYYFPQESIPKIFTCISGFNQSVIMGDGFAGIALDNYLGADCIYYEYLGVFNYKRQNMKPDRILPDLFQAKAISMFEYNDSIDHLLSNMIYEGKVHYFVEAMNPQMEDSTLMGYSEKQLEWCKINEANMWTYLAEHKLLYDFDRLNIRKFIGNGPNTSAFSTESPSRTGCWLGWQIVRSFMNKHPELSLSALMQIDDAQYILSNSAYHPN